LEDYKKFKASRAAALPKPATRSVDPSQFQGLVPLKRSNDEEEIKVPTKVDKKSEVDPQKKEAKQKKKKNEKKTLADLEPKPKETKEETKDTKNDQPKDLSNLAHRPRMQISKERCKDWSKVTDAVTTGNVKLFTQLMEKGKFMCNHY
jgi:hypothetical protein